MMHKTRITLFGAASIATTAFALCAPATAFAQPSQSAQASKSPDRPAVRYNYTVEYSPNAFDIKYNYRFDLKEPARWMVVPMPHTNSAQIVRSYELILNGKAVSFEVMKSRQGMPWAIFEGQGLTSGVVEWRCTGVMFNAALVSDKPGTIPDWAPAPPTAEEYARKREMNGYVALKSERVAAIDSFINHYGLKSGKRLVDTQEAIFAALTKDFKYESGVFDTASVWEKKSFNCNGGSALFAGCMSSLGFAANMQYGLTPTGEGHQLISISDGGPWFMIETTSFDDGVTGLTVHGHKNFLVLSEGGLNILDDTSGKNRFFINAAFVHSLFIIGDNGVRLLKTGGSPVKLEFRPLTEKELEALPKRAPAQASSNKAPAQPSPSKPSSKKR